MLSYLRVPILLLLDLVAPRGCAACGAAAMPAPCAFCEECMAQSQLLSREVEGSWALLAFSGPAQRAVHRAKYEKDDLAASAIGAMLGAHLPATFAAFDCVVPVPVGGGRLRERGFDQAALIAKEVASALRLSFLPTGLRRHKETRALAKLDHGERRGAIAGAFVATPRVEQRRVILIDDVVTSGATSDEAKDALLRAGAKEVAVVCFAKTLKRQGTGNGERSEKSRERGTV